MEISNTYRINLYCAICQSEYFEAKVSFYKNVRLRQTHFAYGVGPRFAGTRATFMCD